MKTFWILIYFRTFKIYFLTFCGNVLNDVTDVFRDVKLTLDHVGHGLLSNHAPSKFLKIVFVEKFPNFDVTLNLHNFLPKLLLNISKFC